MKTYEYSITIKPDSSFKYQVNVWVLNTDGRRGSTVGHDSTSTLFFAKRMARRMARNHYKAQKWSGTYRVGR